MYRIRKNGKTAKIKVVVEKECPVDELDAGMDAIENDVERAFAMMGAALEFADEIRVDKDMSLFTKQAAAVAAEAVDPPEDV